MAKIHPSAIIEDGAQIAASAEIGPMCWISSQAKIGENVKLLGQVTVFGNTTIGNGTIVFPGARLGCGPQDHGNEFQPEAKLIIGERNIIRENVTMHSGTPKEHFTTVVGNDGMFMINSHIAHDCVVGNNVIMTNNAVIGGHVHLGDGVILGGNCAVHQFVHIGRKAMVGGVSGVARDIIPFGIANGMPAKLRGLNVVGLKRSGVDEATIKSCTRAFMFIFKGSTGNFEERLKQAEEKFKDNAMVMEQIAFIKESLSGKRNVTIAE
ncbi:MAG: acyl-ACP--UDP-N-acetylglucosamine O-acyltransferase [Alphaproteobacteria bacterium]|nr:acyl-ACP--UDP-N-acetylglucosamine O-acyltransferase [Alphaproteobacteria bacterium]MBR3662103.1 acyl-ACP--UDP-N-acetylglucosamine O-acyltransferase [Alphaproteobacteria bacterium]